MGFPQNRYLNVKTYCFVQIENNDIKLSSQRKKLHSTLNLFFIINPETKYICIGDITILKKIV